MKKNNIKNYHIQSINNHLINILEDSYYIELGNVNIQALMRLLKHQPLSITDLFNEKLLVNGIGKITNEEDYDAAYQFNFLYSLHQKSSSSKFVLTCGTLKYSDSNDLEKYAPIILIPLNVDYVSKKIYIAAEPIINNVLIRFLRKNGFVAEENNNEFEQLVSSKVQSVSDIDLICGELALITNLNFSTLNYLTIMEVEYRDFVLRNDFFAIERSIFETNDITLMKDFFKNVSPILPTNIEQKYILLKAHLGENLAIDGRLGTGKTYTIINMIADAIASNKKVLYVNQDLDSINELRKKLAYLGLTNYVFDITKNVWDTSDILPISVSKQHPFNENILNDVESFYHVYDYKYYGYPYRYIMEKLSILKANGQKDIIKIEKNLYRNEVEYVYKSLKEIESRLKNITPFPVNPWATLLSSNKAPTVPQIIDRTNRFYNQTEQIIKTLKDLCSKYKLYPIKNISEFNHFNEELLSFTRIKPQKIWLDESAFADAKKALKEIADDSDVCYNTGIYYQDNTSHDYQTGSISKLFDDIVGEIYNITSLTSEDVVYVNRILEQNNRFELLSNDASILVNDSINNYKEIAKLFEYKSSSNDNFIFLNEVLKCFEDYDIQGVWIKEYLSTNKINEEKYNKLKQLITDKAEEKSIFEKYLNNSLFSLEDLIAFSKYKHFNRLIKKQLNTSLIKKEHKNVLDIENAVIKYYQDCQEIIKLLPEGTLGSLHDEKIWDEYYGFLTFLSNISKNNLKHLLIVFNKIAAKEITIPELITILSKLKTNEQTLARIEEEFSYYHIPIGGPDFITVIESISEYLLYLKKAIQTKNIIYKNFNNVENIKVKDILILKEVDKVYSESLKRMKKNKNRYELLFGESYLGNDTVVSLIGQSMDYFKAFSKRLINEDDVNDFFDNKLNELIEKLPSFISLYSEWYSALRGFSTCFFGGKMSLQENDFSKNFSLLKKHIEILDQVNDVSRIEYILDSFYEFGLKTLADGIQDGKFSEGIAVTYLYSTLNKYYTDLIDQGFKEFNKNKMEEVFKLFQDEEKLFCESNIYKLRENKSFSYIKIDKHLESIPFDDYAQLIDITLPYKNIFIGDIGVLNSGLDLSGFDLVIFDDAHLASANKYIRLGEANQAVVFGDKSFKSSISNTLMQRIGDKGIISLHKRYIESTNKFGNSWQWNNQYIFDPFIKINTIKVKDFDGIADEIVKNFINHKNLINVIVTSKNDKLMLYKEIVDKLSRDFTQNETIEILNYSIRIIEAISDNMRFADSVYILYDDIRPLDEVTRNILIRNYIVAKKEINICYLAKRFSKVNLATEQEINSLVGEATSRNLFQEGIVSVINDILEEKGYEVLKGFGNFDIVIKKDELITGVMIEGKRSDGAYSLVDEYLFYITEYSKENWRIKIYTMEDLFHDFDAVINDITFGLGK